VTWPRLRLLVLVFALAGVAATIVLERSATKKDDLVDVRSRPSDTPTVAPHTTLVERGSGALSEAVQDPATASLGDRVLFAGGLTRADTSTDRIVSVAGTSGRHLGRLPGAQHDAAAVALGGFVYVFGGGDISQFDHILRVDPHTGAVTQVGRLPHASSDVAAAAVNNEAYVIGGYTGTQWLNTIVAWRPGQPARVAGRLPVPLRYAAATAIEGKVLIAGGSTPAGAASRAVLLFDPASGRVRKIASLPAPTTHAAAATLAGTAYVIGGRGSDPGTPVARIVSVDPVHGRVRNAGRLREPLSDLGATATTRAIVVVGGHGPAGAIATIGRLVPSKAARTNKSATTIKRPAKTAAVAPVNVYGHALKGMVAALTRNDPERVYVPNSGSNTVDVIDAHTYRIVDSFAVGALPQHVTPAYDLNTLYVNNDLGNSLTPIDPRTSRPGAPIAVDDPYNLYFIPGGRYAIVVAERLHRLDFRNARTFRLHRSLTVPCSGVNHMDFNADGSFAIVSCEFSGQLLKLDVRRERVAGTLKLRASAIPQDVRLAPNGRLFYVADLAAGGVWKIDGRRLRVVGFDATGAGAHGLVVSRNARWLYVANRNAGTISVISFKTTHVVRTWRIPGGGSPDMGGVSSDGRVLWLSGRYNSCVYAIDTRNGRLLARIPVGASPHGVLVWPQPGRYSLGHVGILR
jgi:YVTN family beta-propeller protein